MNPESGSQSLAAGALNMSLKDDVATKVLSSRWLRVQSHVFLECIQDPDILCQGGASPSGTFWLQEPSQMA